MVIMAVKHQFSAFLIQDTADFVAVDQSPGLAVMTGCRGVMDQDHPKEIHGSGMGEHFWQSFQLLGAYLAACQPGSGWYGAAQSDECHGSSTADEGKGKGKGGIGFVAGHPGFPHVHDGFPRGSGIYVVIARDDGQILGRHEIPEAFAYLFTFVGQAELCKVARDDEVLSIPKSELYQGIEDCRQVFVASGGSPGIIAEQALADQAVPGSALRICQMRIGNVAE